MRVESTSYLLDFIKLIINKPIETIKSKSVTMLIPILSKNIEKIIIAKCTTEIKNIVFLFRIAKIPYPIRNSSI